MELACGEPCRAPVFAEDSAVSELDALLVQPALARTPTVTYLGMSPPVRSGAANPWAHDRSWARTAYSASHTNLQALRELDSTGESFLRAGRHGSGRLGGSGGAGSVDAASLVLASPDPSARPLGEAADAEDAAAAAEAEAGAGCYALPDDAGEESQSDAGSESTVGAAASAAGADGGPAPAAPGLAAALALAAGRAAAAPLAHPPASALRARLAAGGAPAAHALLGQPAGASKPPAAPRPAKASLEPFACHTQYYRA
ncbi:hypothetical protein Rsub_10150 [Raphidocelis subcapitata]|uniref:Uncharacterized protein n=1 Tax=Raphidocelis subcapitata TaxID=307507 RepID=A0A2V0PDF8_9CHLO|nr:hypothetical protein Rsub_10150 [Raphidocelis subcapitata]|eukprot:GBF97549.1 hypothetical protein Rsub_10150 [Raphidocelis subcapitata]